MKISYALTIIDDNEDDIAILRNYLKRLTGFEAGEAFTDAIAGMDYLMNGPQGQIVFLDIEMPGMKGTDMAKQVAHRQHYIIFTTAYLKYSLDAIKMEINDYLLKPYDFSDLTFVLNRFKERLQRNRLKVSLFSYLFVYVGTTQTSKLIKVALADIIYIECDDNYINIFTINGKIRALYALKTLEQDFAHLPQFCQVHRSYMVNMDHLTEVERNVLKLPGKELILKPGFRNQFLNRINHILIRKDRSH